MRQYYIYDGQLKKGPFSLEELKLQTLTRETPVWYEGLEHWEMAAKLNELKEYFIIKNMPPPFPRSSVNTANFRDDILKSFSEAEPNLPEPVKKSYLIPIVILAIIVIAAVMFFYPIKFH